MIIIIDNYDSFTFNLFQLISAQHHDVQVLRNDRIGIVEIERLQPQAIILSPGPGRPENAGICVQVIKELGGKFPIFGVCLGHQAIAYAFGTKIINSSQITHGKNSLIFHSRKNIYKNLPLPFRAGRYHSLCVDRNSLSQELLIDAENAAGEIMGIRHHTYPIYGVQYHPESILTPEGGTILANFFNEVVLC